MKKTLLKLLSVLQVSSLVAGMMTLSATAYQQEKTGMWLKGDFHTHTYLSDGSYSAPEVAAHAKQFGLDWYSAADHGGSSVGGRDQNGVAWAAGTEGLVGGKLPRWASINGIGESEINNNRKSILQISGFEWNVPTHEHASVGIVGDSETVKKQLAIFDYTYDGTAEAKNTTVDWLSGINRSLDGKTEGVDSKVLTNNSHGGAISGADYLQKNFPNTSYFLPNHPSRALNYTAADFKEFNDIAPDVCFGAELLPGHQASAFRGGLGYVTVYDNVAKKNVNIASKTGTTFQQKLDTYIGEIVTAQTAIVNDTTKSAADKSAAQVKIDAYSDAANKSTMLTSLQSNVAKQRTYGGADYMLAKIGGTYDTMLSEGRHFWLFGNSDFHIDSEKAATQPGSEPDFWPGEYSKNYTYTYGKDYQSILNGMRSGNSFSVLGDLINALDYKIVNNNVNATMGQTLTPIKGKDTVVSIRFKSPDKNNDGDKPSVDHIDLIAGEVKGEPAVKYVDSSKTNITNFTDSKQYLTAEYQNDDVSATTKVIKTFNKSEFTVDSEGYSTVTFTIPATDKNMYYRLRGTNNAPGAVDANGVMNVDANGNPTIDTPVDSFAGDNTVKKAYADLWFYSNPIFVNSQIDGVTITGTFKDSTGKILANKDLELNSTVQLTKTDANGKFTFTNVDFGIHTIYVKDANGNVESQMSFKLQRGDKTSFLKGDVWVNNNASSIELNFMVNGSEMSITSASDTLVPLSNTTGNPKTGKPVNTALIVFFSASAVMLAVKLSSRKKVMKGIK